MNWILYVLICLAVPGCLAAAISDDQIPQQNSDRNGSSVRKDKSVPRKMADGLRRGGGLWRLARAPQVFVPICLSHVDRQADLIN